MIVVLWLGLQYHFTSVPHVLLEHWSQAVSLSAVVGLVLVYLASTTPINIAINMALAPYKPEPTNYNGLDKANFVFGPLERWLVISLVLVEQLVLVGFFVLASAIFRFAEILREDNRRVAQYVVFDWLMNVVAGLALGALARIVWQTHSV